jgi:hypothetical protein
MKINTSSGNHNTSKTSVVNKDKKFKEDDHNMDGETLNQQDKKIGVKSIRKTLRSLSSDFAKDEMDLMIWVIFILLN